MILKSLTKDWILEENSHQMSKSASNALFELAKKYFFKLYEAHQQDGVSCRIPKFEHLRDQMYKLKVPPISLEVAYKNKESGVITTVKEVDSTPVGQFPRSQYTKQYEIASVKVNNSPCSSKNKTQRPLFNLWLNICIATQTRSTITITDCFSLCFTVFSLCYFINKNSFSCIVASQ